MVNTGHPSRACKLCRARRIKCDETKPFCLKCAKSKRVCPGYRDAFEINLRDETQSTIRKAKSAALRKAIREGRAAEQDEEGEGHTQAKVMEWTPPAAPPPRQQRVNIIPVTSDDDWLDRYSNSSSSEVSPSMSYASSLSYISNQAPDTFVSFKDIEGGTYGMPHTLQTPLDQQATCYFLANYVLAPPTGVGRGILTFVLPLLNMPSYQASPLQSAFSAVSMAALAGRPHSRRLSSMANLHYSKALEDLTRAMQDRIAVRQDTTLASAILLAFYEGLVSDDVEMSGFKKHISGATAIVKLRGPQQTQSGVGLSMFEFVRATSIRQYTFVSNISTEDLTWWARQAVCDTVGHQALVLNLQTTLIRAEADSLLKGARTTDKIDKALMLLQRARNMDDELGVWFNRCPPAWRKVVSGSAADVPDDKLALVSAFPGPIYDYPNVWAAGKHINTHVSRLLLNQVIVRCIAWVCAPSDHTLTKEYIDANAIGTEQVADIISSTPYFFGWTGDALSTPYFPCGTSEMPKGLAGVSCMWPLLATGSSRFATKKQRIYIKARLARIAEEMGIRQADVFSKQIMLQSPEPDPANSYCPDTYLHLRK
ncbi:Negative acting factor [Colletotrichum higginsianum IMI 349063]|uniref:Negative acting factor n=3 Tax=Colletotrichum higginsianum TaxID=80884 RepID=A0A1B7Y4D5_COLHI|nr:Negative acting factor [Colletotrichum higginsianum IMI 349063]OBR06880.1 Negative acting factor [Colletotrichum higginsianum IMI 349063]TIC97303.1 Transcriptional regulatory protein moc3 [Colletotrichum higginsianum]